MRIITEIKVIDDVGEDVPQEEMDAHARNVYGRMEEELGESSKF